MCMNVHSRFICNNKKPESWESLKQDAESHIRRGHVSERGETTSQNESLEKLTGHMQDKPADIPQK